MALLDPGKLPPSNIQTDQSPYPFWALERWIRALVAFLIQTVIGDGASTVVWRPGAVSSGNVFATWAEVAAQVAKMNGAITIVLDTELAPAVIPAGAWDLRPPGVNGPVMIVNGTKPFIVPLITIANAAVTIHGLRGLVDVQVDNQSTSDVILGGVGGDFGIDFYLSGSAAIYQNTLSAGAAFIKNNGGQLQVYMADLAFISTLDVGTHAIQNIAPGFVSMSIGDSSTLDTNQFSSPNVASIFVSSIGSFGFPGFLTQPAAPLSFPHGMILQGTAAILVGTGKTAAIPVFVDANTRILVSLKTPVGDALTVKYAALAADRVAGVPGSFKISALVAAGGGAVNGVDTSTIDWEVVQSS